MRQQPDFVAELRSDLVDWQRWPSRVLVLAYAAVAGLAVVALTSLSEVALQIFDALQHWQPLAPLVWIPLWTAVLAWVTVKRVPGAAGSGIPQVMAALSPGTPPHQMPLFVSLKLSVAKIALTAGGLLGAWRSDVKGRRCRLLPA